MGSSRRCDENVQRSHASGSHRVKAQAWAEYERVKAQALAEHRRVEAQAWAEYRRVKAQALAEMLS